MTVSDRELAAVEDFDIVLSRGQSAHSRVARLWGGAATRSYSHVGVAHRLAGRVFVLHATPDGTAANGIRDDEFQAFLNLSDASAFEILRRESLTVAARASLSAALERLRTAQIPFDYSFDNFNHERLYCSELVQVLFEQAGLLLEKSFAEKKAVPPGRFLYAPGLVSVAVKTGADGEEDGGLACSRKK